MTAIFLWLEVGNGAQLRNSISNTVWTRVEDYDVGKSSSSRYSRRSYSPDFPEISIGARLLKGQQDYDFFIRNYHQLTMPLNYSKWDQLEVQTLILPLRQVCLNRFGLAIGRFGYRGTPQCRSQVFSSVCSTGSFYGKGLRLEPLIDGSKETSTRNARRGIIKSRA